MQDMDKLINEVLLWTPTYGRSSIDQPAKKVLSSGHIKNNGW